MSRVAIFTDSASDLDPAGAAAAGHHDRAAARDLRVRDVQGRRRHVDRRSSGSGWSRPDAPFPKTAASSPGEFKDAYEAAFEAGAEAIVSIHVAGTLSGTIKSAQIARDMLPDREIHVVDSLGASMAEGILARMARRARRRRPAGRRDRRDSSRRGRRDMRMYVALETLEYLKKGGRISGAQAAIGTLLSVKPIIRVKDGVVDTVDRVRTRGKARERLIELICRAADRAAGDPAHDQPGRRGVPRRGRARGAGGSTPADVSIGLVGASVGPHLGPGCVGAAVLYRSLSGPRHTGLSRSPGVETVAARLRQPCRPVPSGRRGSAEAAAILGSRMSRAQPSDPVDRDRRRARGVVRETTRSDGGRSTARHVRNSIP